MPKKNESFEENFKKLETFVSELKGDDILLDDLVPKMKEALSSIKVCKDVLKKTEEQLEMVKVELDEIVDSDEG